MNCLLRLDVPNMKKLQFLTWKVLFCLNFAILCCVCNWNTHTKALRIKFEYLRALIQRQFAIVRCGTTLRSIQYKHVTCRKGKAGTLSPTMLDLPREHVAFKDLSLTNTGLDIMARFPCCRNFQLKNGRNYGILITFLTTDAGHFEVIPSLVSGSCVMGIESLSLDETFHPSPDLKTGRFFHRWKGIVDHHPQVESTTFDWNSRCR